MEQAEQKAGGGVGSEFTRMPLTRMGIVFLLSVAFAATLAGLVHYADRYERDGGCRISSNPACSSP
jgi:hypothetical protein